MEDWGEISVCNVLSHRNIETEVPKLSTKPTCNPRTQEFETGDSTEKGDYLN